MLSRVQGVAGNDFDSRYSRVVFAFQNLLEADPGAIVQRAIESDRVSGRTNFTPVQPGPRIQRMNPNKALWEKGDFTRIAAAMRESGEALLQRIRVKKGMKVLVLGCATARRRYPLRIRTLDMPLRHFHTGNHDS